MLFWPCDCTRPHEYKQGELKIGPWRKGKEPEAAVAIALNEARKSGARIPRKKSAGK